MRESRFVFKMTDPPDPTEIAAAALTLKRSNPRMLFVGEPRPVNLGQVDPTKVAVDYLNAKSYQARGLYIYRADEASEYYIIDDYAMSKLGYMIAGEVPDVYAEWCHVTNVVEVNAESVVHDSSIREDTDLDALQTEAAEADDMATWMMLNFYREEIEIEAARAAEERLGAEAR